MERVGFIGLGLMGQAMARNLQRANFPLTVFARNMARARELVLDLPSFLLTPHVAWSSRETMQRLADQLFENIEAFVSGSPRNLVG